MSITKQHRYSSPNFLALNQPKNWSEYKPIVKLASIEKINPREVGGFDLVSAIKDHPEHLFVKIFAIKANEVNDNGDSFSTKELKKATGTFIGVPVFCNHQHDDIEKARGKVVHAWYDNDKDGIWIISRIDRVAYPRLVRGIEEGYVAGSSMGCSVSYSICSICHNVASTSDEFCEHVQERKNKKVSGKYPCKYHKSSNKPTDDCPVCGSTAKEAKSNELHDALVFEHNYDIAFIEDSFVVNQACHDCVVDSVFNADGLAKKIASLKDQVQKIDTWNKCPDNTCPIEREAGKQEIDDLNEAMDRIERVSKSMMSQKERVSMEYVSDLVKAMASIQDTIDQLVEMGYLYIPSPAGESIGMETTGPPLSPQPSPEAFGGQQTIETPVAPGIGSEQIGDVGSVTGPKTSEIDLRNKKESQTNSKNVFKRLSEVNDIINSLEKQVNIHEEQDTIMSEESKEKMEKVAEHPVDVITEKQLPNAEFTGERWNDAPNKITEKQLDTPNENKDANVTTSVSPQARLGSYDVITEKQLNSVESGYVTRWGDWPDVITEKQWTDVSRWIGSQLSKDQDTIITEKQLLDFRDNHRFTQPASVITEKQLNDDSLTTTGDLSRWAYTFNPKKTAFAAMDAAAEAIAFYGKTPADIARSASAMTSSVENKAKAAFLVAINSLPHKAAGRQEDMERCSYFSKVSSSSVRPPSATDALLVTMASNIKNISADDIVDALKVVANDKRSLRKIEKMAVSKSSSPPEMRAEINKSAQVMDAIREIDRPEDGIYQIRATLDEIGVNPSNNVKKKAEFLKATHKFAAKMINDDDVNFVITKVHVDDKLGTIVATAKSIDNLNEQEKKVFAQAVAAPRPTGMVYDDIVSGDADSDFVPDPAASQEAVIDPSLFDDIDANVTNDEIVAKVPGTRPTFASTNINLRRQKREAMTKEAQMLGGEMGGGMGAGATMPAPPQATPGGAPGAPGETPIESFEQSDIGMGLEDTVEEDLQPKPPGATCPACTSGDVDVVDGLHKCNNCGTEFYTKVVVEVAKWSGVTDDGDEGEDEEGLGGGLGEDMVGEGEGYELPEAGMEEVAPAAAPAPPIAASTSSRIKKTANSVGYAIMMPLSPSVIKKQAVAGIKLGSVSPVTATTNTLDLGKGRHFCLDTGTIYTLAFKVDKKNPKQVYAQWEWYPKTAEAGCSSCSQSRERFLEALSQKDMTEEQFDALSLKEKGDTILALKAAGLLKVVKTAGTSQSALAIFKEAQINLGQTKFPIESCMERLARRYGKDAIALSGPCEGKPLYDCVCNSLKRAGVVYSNNLAIKVASIWSDKDGSSECLEDYIRMGFDVKQSSAICTGLKQKYAQFEDNFVDELETAIDDFGDEDVDDEADRGLDIVDPFDDEDDGMGPDMGPDMEPGMEDGMEPGMESGGTVSVELPIDVVEQIDAALDSALGETTEGILPEGDIGMGEDEIGPVEEGDIIPGEEADINGDIVEDVADDAVEVVVEDELEGPEIGVEDGEAEDCTPCSSEEVKNVEYGDDSEYSNNNKGREPNLREEERKEMLLMEDRMEDDENAQWKEGVDRADRRRDPAIMADNSVHMRTGHISHSGEVNLDLTNVIESFRKKADSVPVKSEPAQDVAKRVVGDISGSQTLGDESKFTADTPDVPVSSNAQMGQEEKIQNQVATVFTGPAQMGDEELNSEETDIATGGEQGQGGTDDGDDIVAYVSYKDRLGKMAERILEASERKVVRKQPQDDPDIQPISDGSGSFIGGEKESIGDVPKAQVAKEQNVPTAGKDGGFIGNEKESIGDKPTDADTPDIPADNQLIGGEKDNEKIAPEKQEQATGNVNSGNVQASSQGGSKNAVIEESFRIAGKMLSTGKINPDGLAKKVAELQQYKISQLRDIEKAIFNGQKGLDTLPDGLERPVVISENSNQRNARDELVNKLSGMFTLSGRVAEADSNELVQLRKAYGR